MGSTITRTTGIDADQHQNKRTEAIGLDARTAGIVALVGVGLSVVGAVLNQAIVDVDIYAAMDAASPVEQARLLTQVADSQTSLVAGFIVWMFAFPAVAASSILLARMGRQTPLTALIRHAATASMGAIMVFLSMIITFVVVLAPAHVAGEDVLTLAHTVGFTATTIDWVISAFVLGLAPAAAVYAGRGIWAPRWLQGLAAATVVVTVIEVIGLIVNNRDVLFPIVPFGLALHACAGVCAIRYASKPDRVV